MDRIVGFGFRPRDDELISHYLKHKILGETWLVDNAISEVNIYAFDPWELRFQSKIDTSHDGVWYFLFRPEKKKMQSRKTRSGFWKKTGPTLDIKPRRGNHGKIGEKKVLVFHRGRTPNGVGTEWVMHEYHTSSFLPDQRTYIICRIEFKGKDPNVPHANAIEPSHSFVTNLNNVGDWSSTSEVNQPVHGNSGSYNWQAGLSMGELQSMNQFSANLDTQQQVPYWDEDEMQMFLDSLNGESLDFMLDEQDTPSYNVMQQNCNDYRPQKALTGTYMDDSSDSDDASSSLSSSVTSRGETSSWVAGSASSSNGHLQTHKNNNLESSTDHYHHEESRSLQKHVKGEYQSVMQRKEEVRRVADASEKESSCLEKIEMEGKRARDRFRKTSDSNTKKKGWFVLEDVVDKSRTNELINMIIGMVLLVFLIPLITSVR